MQTLATAQLLGRPRVFLDGSAVRFPFKQAEALFYYILLEREATKDVLAEVIWESSLDMDKAQKSMRNALYVLRKQFGRELFVEPVKNLLQISPALRPQCDIDLLYAGDELPAEFYRGDFLKGFYLKKSPLYNDWVDGRRRELQSLYIKRCNAQIAQCLASGELERCEALCGRVLEIDPYDDHVYLSLMESLRLRGQYVRASSVYERLETLYREELFEPPSAEMRAAVRKLREEAQTARAALAETLPERPALFGRGEEDACISGAVESYFATGSPAGVLLTGEAGVGKTRLAEEVLERLGVGDTAVISTTCFQAEAKYALRPWQPVLRQLRERLAAAGDKTAMPETYADALQYADAETAVTYLLKRVGRSRRLILYFDDLQWADEATISLIHRLQSDRSVRVFFVLLLQEVAVREKYLRDFLSRMRYSRRMQTVALRRLDAKDTVDMARSLLPGYPFTGQAERQFYRETEGNPLFVVELANSIRRDGSLRDITPGIRELIKSRIEEVPQSCRSLLELLSLFYSGASFELLHKLSQKDDGELVEELEFLIRQKFIREKRVEGESVYKFTHQKIPEFIYNSMSQAKRRVFHRKAGNYYEALLERGGGDTGHYTYLIHHYERAGMRDKYLEYTIRYIDAYLGMAHEYFPVVNPTLINPAMGMQDSGESQALANVQGLGMHITMEEILELLGEFTGKLGEDPAKWDRHSHALISHCYHLISRYYIQSCRYEEGLKYAFRLKQINRGAADAEQLRSLLAAYKLQLYIYINRHEVKGMQGALKEAFALLPMLDDAMESAVWTRMNGMFLVMSGNIERGVDELEKAIRMFRSSARSKLFLYNMAAAYAWLGEARRHLFDAETAVAYYRKAIRACESYYWIGGVAVFYTYAGMNAFDSGDYEQAGAYLAAAVESYGRSSFLWGRGLALGYSALFSAEQGDLGQAAEYLEGAARSTKAFGSRAEQGTLLRIKAMLRRRMDMQQWRTCLFDQLLSNSVEQYIAQARAMLRGVFSPVDSLYLARLESGGEALGTALY